MENEPATLSIISVVKNDLEGLRRTSISVRKQAGVKICHIIVDGGSQDGSQLFAAEVSDVSIPSFDDGGIYPGMQRGANVVNTKYLMFLNSSDELIGTEMLAGVIELLERQDAEWGFGPIIEQTARGTRILTSAEGPEDLESIAWRRTFVPFPTTVMRKALFDAIGGFSYDFRIAGDFDLIVRAAKMAKPLHWSTPYVLFQAGGISYTAAPSSWLEEHRIRMTTLDMTVFGKMRSRIRVLLRIAKWSLGKTMDFIQNTGAFGKIHWRDRKGTLAPSWIVQQIDSNERTNQQPDRGISSQDI